MTPQPQKIDITPCFLTPTRCKKSFFDDFFVSARCKKSFFLVLKCSGHHFRVFY